MIDLSGVINENASVSHMLGISPGAARLPGYEGQQLPASTVSGQDKAQVPWSVDSPLFWGAVLVGGTLLGLFGASVNVRAGRAHGRVEVGKS